MVNCAAQLIFDVSAQHVRNAANQDFRLTGNWYGKGQWEKPVVFFAFYMKRI
jgi:hypothetical protein